MLEISYNYTKGTTRKNARKRDGLACHAKVKRQRISALRNPQSGFRMDNLSRRNQMKADGNFFPDFALGWTNGANGV